MWRGVIIGKKGKGILTFKYRNADKLQQSMGQGRKRIRLLVSSES
jgi:hypothetical protein